MAHQLELEYKTYQNHLEDFISNHLGEFVLIKGEKIVNFYVSYKEALKAGLTQFGNVPFFVKRVSKEEKVHVFLSGLENNVA